MSTTYVVETAPMSYHQASYPRDEVRAYRFVDGEGRAFWRDPWEGSGHYFRRGEEDVVPAIVLYMLFFLMVTSMFIFCFGQLMTSSGFIMGFFCWFPWLCGCCFLRSPSPTARALGFASFFLFLVFFPLLIFFSTWGTHPGWYEH